MLYILFLVFAAVFLALENGLFGLRLNVSVDLFYLNLSLLKIRARISPVTVFLTAAWFTGLNKVVGTYLVIPVWVVIPIIFIVLPSIFATLFNRESKERD